MRLSLRSGSAGLHLGLVLVMVLAACASGPDVTREELSEVVERDAVPFTGPALPTEVLDDVASHRVVLLGETHHLREHWEFTTTLLEDLHERGFRQLLVEQPQMADWWIDGYVGAGVFDPGWQAPPNWVRKFSALRAFNETLPKPERIHVRAIDANEAYYGGADAFRSLLDGLVGYLEMQGPVADFLLADYSSAEEQAAAISSLHEGLQADEASLIESWGPEWYAAIVEMVEVEGASIDIRVDRAEDDDAAARAREIVIKELAEARITGTGHGTVINIGGHHAQKSPLMGTDQEWLGDYLSNESPAADGSVIIIGFTSARTLLEDGAGGTPFDVTENSPDNELLRTMAESWPDRNVYLRLTDPVFSERLVAYNSEDVIYATRLNEIYDALVQYGTAHRWPED